MALDYTNEAPEGWKTYDDFVKDMNTPGYRLEGTEELAGKEFSFDFEGEKLTLKFDKETVAWETAKDSGVDKYEAVNTAPDTYIVTYGISKNKIDAQTVVFNVKTFRAISVYNYIKQGEIKLEPRFGQVFKGGVLLGGTPTGIAPYRTKELIGLKALYTYSEEHTYEHYYITASHFCWKCFRGEQYGQVSIEPAEYWKFDEHQFVFGWCEVVIPTSPIWFIDYGYDERYSLRETGTFFNCNPDGTIRLEKAGATIEKLNQTYYPSKYDQI